MLSLATAASQPAVTRAESRARGVRGIRNKVEMGPAQCRGLLRVACIAVWVATEPLGVIAAALVPPPHPQQNASSTLATRNRGVGRRARAARDSPTRSRDPLPRLPLPIDYPLPARSQGHVPSELLPPRGLPRAIRAWRTSSKRLTLVDVNFSNSSLPNELTFEFAARPSTEIGIRTGFSVEESARAYRRRIDDEHGQSQSEVRGMPALSAGGSAG